MGTVFSSRWFVAAAALGVGLSVGWWGGLRSGERAAGAGNGAGEGAGSGHAAERRLKYYQSPMHPWIRSSKPGNCTICGMKLAPVYEGEADVEKQGDAVGVTLSKSIVQTVGIATEPVAKRELRRTLLASGMVEDDEARRRKVAVFAEGRVDKVFIGSVGVHVLAGQALARVFSPEIAAARREFLKVSRQPTGSESARQVMAARERLVRMGLSAAQIDTPENAGDQTALFDLLAPQNGVVMARSVTEGQAFKEGEVLFETSDFSRVWFVAEVFEGDLPEVRLGQRVEVRTPAAPGRVLEAAVDYLDPVVMPETRTARVRVVLDNPERENGGRLLLHRSFGQATIHLDAPEVLAVPASAVLNPGGQAYVYVEGAPGSFERREVRLGRKGEGFREVLEGVEAGEKVVVHGGVLIDAQARMESRQ